MNNLTAKRVIKRQYNTIVDEEAKIRRVLAMETDDSLPSQLSIGLLVRVEQHLDIIIEEVGLEESTEDGEIRQAVDMCKEMYQTPTFRAYKGIKSMLDRLARYMETTSIEHGRDGNLTSLVNTAAKFDQIRQSFKGAYNDMKDEQKSQVRGGQGLAYDQL